MNRRSFLSGLAALVGGVAIEQAIPFGRVWSFPKNIVIAKPKLSFSQAIGIMHEQIRPHLPNLYPHRIEWRDDWDLDIMAFTELARSDVSLHPALTAST